MRPFLFAMLALVAGAWMPPARAATDPVGWTQVLQASTGTGGAITKTAGASWYASASGAVALSGDGRFEFKVISIGLSPWINAMRVCLNSGGAVVTDGASMEYCLAIGGGVASVYVLGRWSSDTPISTSDLLGIGIEGGVVRFYRNGSPFYTASGTPTLPVAPFWTTSYDGLGLTAATITTSGTTTPPPPPPPPTGTAIAWTSLVSSSLGANGAIQKVAGNTWYASASSSQTLGGDGRFEFVVNNTGANPWTNAMRVCLNSGSIDVLQPASMEYCAAIGGGYSSVYVQGRWSWDTAIQVGDVLAIAVESGRVKFYRNGTPYYTSTLAPTYPLAAWWTTSYDGYGLTSATLASATTTPTNRPPVISGTTTQTATVGQPWSFTPTASDPDGNALTFSVAGAPAWAAFDTRTGRLSGMPQAANVGTSTVRVIVGDGQATATLQYTLTVVAATTGQATLSWTPPTTRTDGSLLTNLAGYRIYYGTNAASLTTRIDLTNPGLATYVVTNLAPGTWYFQISSVDSGGVESARAGPVSLTIR